MKVIIITSLLVGFLSFLANRELKKQTKTIEREVSEMTLENSRERTQLQNERDRKISQFRPAEGKRDSPFVEELYRELEQKFGRKKADTLDILQKLRGLNLDEIKTLSRQLLSQYSESVSAGQYPLIEASELILLEADPLFLLQDDDLRQAAYQIWAKRAGAAFQSLLRKDPKAARSYFEEISIEDFQSNRWPFSKMYTQMMGHLFAHDPEGAIKFYRLQKANIRNLPRQGTRGHLSSMDQVMPYAELLRAEKWTDPSVSQLIIWACREADRLAGFEGLARFSKEWTGPKASQAQQDELLLALKLPITSRKRADEFLEMISRGEQSNRRSHLSDLVQAWDNFDLAGASRWIKDQPPGPDRDVMIEALIRGLDWSDPAAIEQWIPLFHDERIRSEQLKIIEEHEKSYEENDSETNQDS